MEFPFVIVITLISTQYTEPRLLEYYKGTKPTQKEPKQFPLIITMVSPRLRHCSVIRCFDGAGRDELGVRCGADEGPDGGGRCWGRRRGGGRYRIGGACYLLPHGTPHVLVHTTGKRKWVSYSKPSWESKTFRVKIIY